VSSTDVRTFEGGGARATGKANLGDGSLRVVIDLTDWQTEGRLRTTHMHEDYLETDRFATAVFVGKLNYVPGAPEASATGNLTLHGVTRKKDLKATVVRRGNEYIVHSDFDILLTDYDIKVPKLVILEVSNVIHVKADFTFVDEGK
jgi:polyisoprenoid-binding protein YceI